MTADDGNSKASMPWFRMYHEFAVDPKVQMLSEADQRRYIMLLCINAAYPGSKVSDADMAWRLRIGAEEWSETKSRLLARDLIRDDNVGTYDGAKPGYLRQSPEVWAKTRRRIFDRDDYTCAYCGERGTVLECDHIVPVTRGGDHSDANLITACRPCNRAKRDKVVSVDDFRAIRRRAS